MPAKVTRFLRSDNAQHFIDNFAEEGSYYLFIGNNQEWYWDTQDESLNDPPNPTEGVESIDFDIWDRIVAMKRIDATDLSLVIPRYNWTSGTVYSKYQDSVDLFANTTNPFYVITSDFKVYKCIDNNKGAQSTVEPRQTELTDTVITDDGYEWKYMYPVVGSDIEKFLSSEYIPVKKATVLDNFNADQFNIQTAATNGTVDSIDVTVSANGFINFSGFIKEYTNTSTIILPTEANATDDQYYKDCNVFVETGDGSGQLRKVSNYVAATRTITFEDPLSLPLSNTAPNPSYIVLGPRVEVLADGDGTPTAYANINPLASNSINYINMINRGRNNTTATAIVKDGFFNNPANLVSVTTTALPNISPPGGHGSDAVRELHNGDLMFSIKLSKTEQEEFLETKDFRTYGILQYPRYRSNNALITERAIDNTLKLKLKQIRGLSNSTFEAYGSNNSGMLAVGMASFDEFAKNFELANSAAAAALDAELYATVNRAFAIDYVSNTTTTGTLSLTSPRYKDGYIFLDEGEGNSGELIRLKHNGAATDWPIDAEATSSEYEGIVEEVIYPVVKKGSGDILYIENRFPIIRDSDQIEDLKMIITY
jgi:hypothetical protein